MMARTTNARTPVGGRASRPPDRRDAGSCQWRRSARGLALGLFAGLFTLPARAAEPIVVGAKDFTEQHLVAAMTAQLLEARGMPAHRRVGFKTEALRRALLDGRVDLYWEYTGTALAVFHGVAERLDPDAGHARIRALDGPLGLAWLAPSRVNNTFALAMRARAAAQLGIGTISDLGSRARAGTDLRFGVTEEFAARPDGLVPMTQAYGFTVEPGVEWMEAGRIYRELRESRIDLGLVFSTDGRVAAYDFRLLVDDRAFFPNYVMAPVVRRATLERVPDLAAPLEALARKLDSATMARLNGRVDLDRLPVETVASEFLAEAGLL